MQWIYIVNNMGHLNSLFAFVRPLPDNEQHSL